MTLMSCFQFYRNSGTFLLQIENTTVHSGAHVTAIESWQKLHIYKSPNTTLLYSSLGLVDAYYARDTV